MAERARSGQRTEGDAPPAWARRLAVAPSGWRAGQGASPRVVVVGPCAAGKTTLVGRLRERGIDAHACAQEHSGVPYLWQLSEPDLLLFLDANRAAIGARRGYEWPVALNDAQQQRLAHARDHADLYLDGSALTLDEIATRAIAFLRGWRGRVE